MSSKFFTNQGTNTLENRLKDILTHYDIKNLEFLIGYFRISGFKKIAKLLDNVDKVKILVGINIDKLTHDAQARGKKFNLFDYEKFNQEFIENQKECLTNEEDFKLWLKENKKWLKDFKFYSKFFQNENFFTYYSQNTIINFEPYQIEKDKITNVKKINEEILGRIIYRSIYFLINYYQLELEKLKKKLFSRWILFNSSSKRLTLLIILINRLNEELKQNIKDKISIIGISKNINDENIEENIADKFMKDIFFKLKEIKKDLKILDNGVTKILSIANTKKSYG